MEFRIALFVCVPPIFESQRTFKIMKRFAKGTIASEWNRTDLDLHTGSFTSIESCRNCRRPTLKRGKHMLQANTCGEIELQV